LVKSRKGTTLYDALLKKKGIENEEDEVGSYWMTLRKWEYTGTWKRKH